MRRQLLNTTLALAGILLGLAQYLYNRSLWLDEAFLADNLLNRDFAGLLQPLDHGQGAPLGFLLLEKLVITLLGRSEYALRLIPLLAGIAAILLLWRVCGRIAPRATPLALAIFGTSNLLIYYASEVKQYASDVTVALVILWAALWTHEQPTPRRLLTFALVGMVAVWFSHPALFALAGVGTVLILWDRLRWRYMVVAAGWAASFFAAYFFFYRNLAQDQGLLRYWDGAFVRLEPTWAIKLPLEPFILLSGLSNWVLLVVFIAGFVIGLRVIQRFDLALLLMPWVFVVAASALGQYPYNSRFILFLLPNVIILIALGLQEFFDQFPPRLRMALLALLLVGLFVRVNVQQTNTEVRAALAYIESQRAPGEVVYLHYRTAIIADYYQYDYLPMDEFPAPGELDTSVWLAYLDIFEGDDVLLREDLAAVSRRVEVRDFPGVTTYHYDLSG